MGHYLIPDDVRSQFVKPLIALTRDFQKTCDQWEQALRSGDLLREDLFLNEGTAKLSLGTLRKLQREIAGKLEDAIAGVYRYREAERGGAIAKGRKTKAMA